MFVGLIYIFLRLFCIYTVRADGWRDLFLESFVTDTYKLID